MPIYYYKFNYDTQKTNCYTAKDGIKAKNKQEAFELVTDHIKNSHPQALNIRNIVFK